MANNAIASKLKSTEGIYLKLIGRLHDNKSKYNHRNKCNVIMSLFLLKYIYMNFDKYCIVNGEGFTVKIDMRSFFPEERCRLLLECQLMFSIFAEENKEEGLIIFLSPK